ncbi:FMN-dependent NADH-azoreductase [Chitinibacteraceae bacterium HSL-7]
MNILQINSSARTQGSVSTQLANEVTAGLLARQPEARVVIRDLASQPVSVLDEAGLMALGTPAESRTAVQQARVAEYDALIAEVQQADAVVLGVPMYNFGVPAQLKHWIDAIARAGVTFRYTANGPEGLLTGKTVYVALARGGMHRDTERDVQTQYLKVVLGFLGMTDVRFIFAEGLSMAGHADQSVATARTEIEQALA